MILLFLKTTNLFLLFCNFSKVDFVFIVIRAAVSFLEFSLKGDDPMDLKTELLICLGAATAANCVPCFDYYFKKASVAGITSEEVKKTVELACKVKPVPAS